MFLNVPLEQEGKLTYTYYFSASPTSLTWNSKDTSSKSVEITSYKKGSDGSTEDVSWQVSSIRTISGLISAFSGGNTSGKGNGSFSVSPTSENKSQLINRGSCTISQGDNSDKSDISISLEQGKLMLTNNHPTLEVENLAPTSKRYYFKTPYPVTSSLSISWTGRVVGEFGEGILTSGTSSISNGSSTSSTVRTLQGNSTLILDSTTVTPSSDENYIYN